MRTRACAVLLSNVVERGLTFDDGIMVVIAGGKGLRAAVNSVFGRLGLVQRCQLHKRRNVLDHLPQHMHAFVAKKLRRKTLPHDRLRCREAIAASPRHDARHPASRRRRVAQGAAGGDTYSRAPRAVAVAAANAARALDRRLHA